jgi:hypothetical protein
MGRAAFQQDLQKWIPKRLHARRRPGSTDGDTPRPWPAPDGFVERRAADRSVPRAGVKAYQDEAGDMPTSRSVFLSR